jgi:ATP-dependent Zn protease
LRSQDQTPHEESAEKQKHKKKQHKKTTNKQNTIKLKTNTTNNKQQKTKKNNKQTKNKLCFFVSFCLFVFVVVFLVEIQTKYKKLDSSGGVWCDPEPAPTREAIWQTRSSVLPIPLHTPPPHTPQ